MEPIIRTENLSKWYRRGKPNEVRALEDINMTIMENQYTVIYGPSGSGKTTLLSLIGTIDRPTNGYIFLNGQDVTLFSDLELSRHRRRLIGIVFQSFCLFNGLTAWENVAHPLIPMGIDGRERFRRAKDLLDRFGLGDRVNNTSEELSGGEQQRVAIARALINDPQILIADEPTSNIDEDSVKTLLDIIAELKGKGKTIVISSHDPLIKDRADVLFNLNRGRLEKVLHLNEEQ